MRHRILGFIGRGRRRRLSLLIGLAGALALAAFVITNALAVHDEGVFQLDGNAFSTANSSAGAPSEICEAVAAPSIRRTTDSASAVSPKVANSSSNRAERCSGTSAGPSW